MFRMPTFVITTLCSPFAWRYRRRRHRIPGATAARRLPVAATGRVGDLNRVAGQAEQEPSPSNNACRNARLTPVVESTTTAARPWPQNAGCNQPRRSSKPKHCGCRVRAAVIRKRLCARTSIADHRRRRRRPPTTTSKNSRSRLLNPARFSETNPSLMKAPASRPSMYGQPIVESELRRRCPLQRDDVARRILRSASTTVSERPRRPPGRARGDWPCP